MAKMSYVIGAVAVAISLLWLKSHLELSMTSVVVGFFAAMLFFAVIGKLLYKAD